MNSIERIKMLKAMEFIARNLNDEEILENWLVVGVADGDIHYGELEVNICDKEEYGCYLSDESFADLMHQFLRCMAKAYKSGGLYCDGIIDKEEQDESNKANIPGKDVYA